MNFGHVINVPIQNALVLAFQAAASHSRSFVQRLFICPPLTAIPIAFFWPTSTTSRLPRVTPVSRNIDDKGKLKIEEYEAKIVVRIFEERVQGKSPRLIAAGLNGDSIPSPRGGKWNASTINGQKGRGIGIVQNELYVGRYRWNKLKFKKPPGSNKRISVSKDEAEHVVVDVPKYRIIEQVLWDKVQAIIGESNTSHISHRRTPPRLLSQLLKCPACGGGISSYGVEKKTGKIRVGCSTHKESRSCPDPRTFYLEWIEETVVET